ncbi:MAG TPA: LLM class flavin-dependent oxidoreductase [Nitrosopumilaceae archaeon]|nr:LLM class flavin-dependent oxidoreductase [Nitrosopumilaceae archaeon]
MRLGYSLGSVLSIEQVLNCASILSNYNPDTVWIPETWGMENFSMLSAISQRLERAKIGSSIINVYSRSPALVAMGAASVDTISNKRLILGLGTSSIPIVEEFHGYKFEKPLVRMREYVEIIRYIISGKKIDYDGKIFSLKNFTLLIKPPRNSIPIYLAAVNQKMVNLTWEIADGVIFYLRPVQELKNIIKQMQSKKKIDVTCQLITCMSNDAEKATERAKKTLAFYISVGKVYREFLGLNGFKNEINNIFQEYNKSGLKSVHELVPESMLEQLCIYGDPNECIKKLKRFYQAGVNLPIIQFNPIGEVTESFNLLTSTFSQIENE